MQTVGDISLEELYSLGDEVEKKCESRWHDSGDDGHRDDSRLYYVDFPIQCDCNGGVQIRCHSHISDLEARMDRLSHSRLGAWFRCTECGKTFTIRRLEPVT